jgi:hypothetical protein
MKNTFLLIAFYFFSLVAMAQSYSISPSNTLHESAVYNEENKFRIFFTNISSASINLHWKVIANNLVAGWDCYICDNVSCCIGVPQKGSMPYIDPGIDVWLALVVNPKAVPGNGTLQLYIYEEGNPSAGDTLTWVVNSIATGLTTFDADSGIAVFPNPASDYVMIDMSASSYMSLNTISVCNSAGQLLIEKKITGATEKLDISTLPKGSSYQVIVSDGKRNRVIKTILK